MGFFTVGIVQTALEVGLVYSLIALSLFLSFSILDICDLSTDGCYTLGCAVGAVMTVAGHPIAGIFCAMLAGVCSGFVTALLQTVFGVPSILAGIIVNTGLYTINLAVMGFSLLDSAFWKSWSDFFLLLLIAAVVCVLLNFFLKTRLGLSIRATGDSRPMVRASSINPNLMVIIGLCLSNSLTGLAGSLIAQYNKMSDINLGTGMVTIALASLIIGETLFGRGRMMIRIVGVVAGAVLYRFIMAIALRLNVPTEAFKLVSALIVAIAIAAPEAKRLISFESRRIRTRRARMAQAAGSRKKGGKQ